MATITPNGELLNVDTRVNGTVRINEGNKYISIGSTRLVFETVERFGTNEVLNRTITQYWG